MIKKQKQDSSSIELTPRGHSVLDRKKKNSTKHPLTTVWLMMLEAVPTYPKISPEAPVRLQLLKL
jgi:hypothetical protein